MPHVPVMPPHANPDLIARVRNLEAALTQSMSLFELLINKLEARLGPDFLGPELSPFQNIGHDTDQQIAQIDQLIKEQKQPAATRTIRGFSGATWDEALQITSRWSSMRHERKVQWMRVHQWAHMLLGSEERSDASDNSESSS